MKLKLKSGLRVRLYFDRHTLTRWATWQAARSQELATAAVLGRWTPGRTTEKLKSLAGGCGFTRAGRPTTSDLIFDRRPEWMFPTRKERQ